LTRIDFHFNAPDRLHYGCRLVRKIYRAGQHVVVFGEAATVAAFDQTLWTFSPLDFIPHVRAGDALADRTPVLLATEPFDPPQADVLVNLGAPTPSFFSRFERVIEVVGEDEEQRAAARERWRFYRDRGYAVTSFDLRAPS
jgi:DNA polymerase-3 subunit chi